MSKVKRIEFTTLDSIKCPPCDLAFDDLKPILQENNIPLEVKKTSEATLVVPLTCVILEKDGVESKKCVQGYGEGYADDVRGLIEE